jgi:hypothetical protein
MFTKITAMRADGFVGFTTIARLRKMMPLELRQELGVYFVVRRSKSPPQFLRKSTGGVSKGRDPTESVRVLGRWAPKKG